MYFLYSLAYSVVFILLLPYFLYSAFKHGKYAGSLSERLGRLPARLKGGAGPTVWVHTVSVGELLAAEPLIAAIRAEMPHIRIVISTTTVTGQTLARSRFGSISAPAGSDLPGGDIREDSAVFYFPFDWRFTVRRALEHIAPNAVVILETELWPNFLHQCRRRGVVTVIANGRISPRSHSRYGKAGRFIKQVLGDVSLFIMQSGSDSQRVLDLGANPERVKICGNLKYDIGKLQELKEATKEIDRRFNLSRATNLIVAGSTAPGEEQMILAALKEIRSRPESKFTRLVLAPRHPERFDEVAGLLASSGFTFARRSEIDAAIPARDENHSGTSPDVLLLDSIGDLAELYRFATVVFIGGSLVPRGGHNIIEPAVYAKPVLVGPYTENFRQIVAEFVAAGAICQLKVSSQAALTQELMRLLENREEAEAMGARGRDILIKNQGATKCTLEAIRLALAPHLRGS